MRISARARLTYAAHLWKACTRQYHMEWHDELERLIPADGVVFDVGAHAGQFTKLFSRIVTDGQVYSFEPGSYARSILTKAVRVHRRRNVEILDVGLGDAPGTLSFSVPIKKSGSIGFGRSHFGTLDPQRRYAQEDVVVDTIDRIMAQYSIPRLDFIKADVEGWELRMLHGASETLRLHRPSLVLEVTGDTLIHAGDSVAAVWEFMRDREYDGFLFDYGLRKLMPAQDGAEGDIFFVAREKRNTAALN